MRIRKSDLDAFLGAGAETRASSTSGDEGDLWKRAEAALAQALTDKERVELAARLTMLAAALSPEMSGTEPRSKPQASSVPNDPSTCRRPPA